MSSAALRMRISRMRRWRAGALAALAQVRAVLVDGVHQVLDALALLRAGGDDRHLPRRRGLAAERAEPQHGAQVGDGLAASGRSHLLTTWMSAISSTPALIAWISSPRPGAETTTTLCAAWTMSTSSWPTPTVSMSTTSKPAASSTSTTSSVAAGKPAQRAARRHAADEDAGIAGQIEHADAVAEDGAAGERAGGIDGDDADRAAGLAEALRQRAAPSSICRCRARR